MYAVIVKYDYSTGHLISIDLLSIKIGIRIISIRISKQSKHRDQQVKGYRESSLSCIKNYALCCTITKMNLMGLKQVLHVNVNKDLPFM